MTHQQDPQAKYLYCIIECPQERTFEGISGIGGADLVHTVVLKDLACVVSASPDTRYESTRQNLLAHEKVIERVMQEFTVLPIRFGTVTGNNGNSPVEDIRHKLLERKFQEFQHLFREMDNRVELGFKALWRDEKAIFEEIVAENSEIHKLRDSLKGRSPESTHLQRMRLGEMVQAALHRKRDQEAKLLLSHLHPLADRVRENKLIMDRMVLNAAFLVSKEREGDFDGVVRRLDEELGDRMVFKYTGPNPPFNFCEIVVSWEEG